MIVVGPARHEDGATLRRIDTLTWTTAVSPAPAPPSNAPFFGPRCSVRDVLVARLEDRVVGYVRIRPATGLAASRHVLEMVGLAVDPAAGGRGVGRALVGAALDAARANGFRRVTLRVLATNTAARALYEACGFTVEGILRGQFNLDNRDVDDVLMAYAIATRRAGTVPG